MSLYPGKLRNEPCMCGSGKKFKKCCGPKHESEILESRKPKPRTPEEIAQAKSRAAEFLGTAMAIAGPEAIAHTIGSVEYKKDPGK